MSDITINLNPTTEAEYKAACEELLLDMKQSEEKFDRLQAEIVLLREEGARIAAEGDVTRAEIDRMMKKLWGPK